MKNSHWTIPALGAIARPSLSASSRLLWCLLAATSFCLLAPAVVSAGVILGIDDGRMFDAVTEDPAVYPVGVAPYGFDPASLSIQSGPQHPEEFDLHGEYNSNGWAVNGVSVVVNFNFFEETPLQNELSDTLNIVFSGHTPVAGDLNDVSVDLHFRSDSDPAGGLTALANAISIFEVPGFMQLDQFIIAAGGPTNFSLAVRSPEPSTFVMLSLGIVSLLGYRLRKRIV